MQRIALWLFTLSLLCSSINGQGPRTHADHRAAPFVNLPGGLDQHVGVLGERMRDPGKQRFILLGYFQDPERRIPLRVTLQHPDLVRVERLDSGAVALTFDGERPNRYSRPEEDLLEVLAADTPEGMFASARNGAAVLLLGTKFKPRDRDYNGPQYDVYEVTGVVRSRSDLPHRSKRYYFDSDTGLLASTRYVDEIDNVKIETRFSNWVSVAGSFFPGQIDRLKNNVAVFSLQFTSASLLPWQEGFPLVDEPIVPQPLVKE